MMVSIRIRLTQLFGMASLLLASACATLSPADRDAHATDPAAPTPQTPQTPQTADDSSSLPGSPNAPLMTDDSPDTTEHDLPINPENEDQPERGIEAASDIRFDGETLFARVISTGCTRSEHFHVEHQWTDGQCLATLVRDRPDLCRRAPAPIEIRVAWTPPPDCDGQMLQFANPPLSQTARKGSSLPWASKTKPEPDVLDSTETPGSE